LSPIGDSFKFGGDGIATKLECGHPNTAAGSKCENCGQVVTSTPEAQTDGSTIQSNTQDGKGPQQEG